MSLKSNFSLLAEYNQWMNNNIYSAAGQLNEDVLKADQGAFFGSVFGTLNHNVVGDIIWLKRFASHARNYQTLQAMNEFKQPDSLRQILCQQLYELQRIRSRLDDIIINWIEECEEADFATIFHYENTRGVASSKKFGSLIQHFFNHQTHHRGQITTLLSQNSVAVGATDLLVIIPNH